MISFEFYNLTIILCLLALFAFIVVWWWYRRRDTLASPLARANRVRAPFAVPSGTSQRIQTKVLIVGAGPTGLALAVDLARRNIAVRIVECDAHGFDASRAKGIQPRTLELFESLGIIDKVLASGCDYPQFRVHLGWFSFTAGRLNKIIPATPDVPYPNLWMLPQSETCRFLKNRFEELGGRVEYRTTLKRFEQSASSVIATVTHVQDDGSTVDELIETEFLVGCDGGHSFVRKSLSVELIGESLGEGAAGVLGDVEIANLDHRYWHAWPLKMLVNGTLLTLCPLPTASGTCFQLNSILRAGAAVPEITPAGIAQFLERLLPKQFTVTNVRWCALYQSPQARLAANFRVGRVFIAGDAAHVHPASGGQGLNTGIQDAVALGWRLAAALKGQCKSAETMLDTYEAERQPIAASVLNLSKKLFVSGNVRRGRDTQQLDLHYRDSLLSDDTRIAAGANLLGLQAGDRAPDSRGHDSNGHAVRLFHLVHVDWTLLVFGHDERFRDAGKALQTKYEFVRIVLVVSADASRDKQSATDLYSSTTTVVFVDSFGFARAAYGVVEHEHAKILVRPDGYIGHYSDTSEWLSINAYFEKLFV